MAFVHFHVRGGCRLAIIFEISETVWNYMAKGLAVMEAGPRLSEESYERIVTDR